MKMVSYFSELLAECGGDLNEAIDKLLDKRKLVSLPSKTGFSHYVNLDKGTMINKNIIEKYSLEYFLAGTELDKSDPKFPLLYKIYNFRADGTVFVKDKLTAYNREYPIGYLLLKLKDGKFKLDIDSLVWLVTNELLEN